MTETLHTALVDLLDRHQVAYKLRHHPRSGFSQETASMLGVSGKQFAKAVLGIDEAGHAVLAVVPADRRVDWERVSRAIGRPARLASQDQVQRLTGLDQPTGLPPFGALVAGPTVTDPSLSGYDSIACAAGSLTDSMTIAWSDYRQVAEPVLTPITDPAKGSR